ncbi:hypothetical protein SAMN05216223_108179 [Actinacidiphila yanglinensis]|uniref:Uncharacterized protein n=2 Tax=Actinacidiphila yanglinensis TaxID=310779 RepID=A0A1H6C8T6_9ACTN|nr:hypothetical protein SAMN05216223_108179 [Actinacidiphila yanglinensis]
MPMPGKAENRSWVRLAALTVAAAVLAVLGVLVAHSVDTPPGGEQCDPMGPAWSEACD